MAVIDSVGRKNTYNKYSEMSGNAFGHFVDVRCILMFFYYIKQQNLLSTLFQKYHFRFKKNQRQKTNPNENYRILSSVVNTIINERICYQKSARHVFKQRNGSELL